MIPFHIIVAIDKDRGIGRNGDLPWHLPTDMRHFKEITLQTQAADKKNVVIMGRKTWESIPDKFRPLSGRINVVLTRDQGYDLSGYLSKDNLPDVPPVMLANSLAEANARLTCPPYQSLVESVFIIGGGDVFREAIKLPNCQKIYLTQIIQSFDCDTFFPPFEETFQRQSFTSVHNENDITFYFAEYLRK